MKSLTIILLLLGLQAVMGLSLRGLEGPIMKCSVPSKFEGKLKLTFKKGTQSGQVQVATGTGTLHADDTIGKGAVFGKVVRNGWTIDTNMYFSNNITYIAMPAMGICQKKAMDIPIIPGKVPAGVTLHIKRGELQGVHVQIWEFSVKASSTTLYLTEDKCMPVRVETNMEISGQNMYVVEHFSDMKKGVNDASVFDLPTICESH